MTYPRSPAAWINFIAESPSRASKDEAVKGLQETWDEMVALRKALRQIADGDNDPRRVAREALALGPISTGERPK